MGDSQQNAWLVKVHNGSQETTFKIDTDVTMIAISKKLYKSFASPSLKNTSKLLTGPNEHPLQVTGIFKESLHHWHNLHRNKYLRSKPPKPTS